VVTPVSPLSGLALSDPDHIGVMETYGGIKAEGKLPKNCLAAFNKGWLCWSRLTSHWSPFALTQTAKLAINSPVDQKPFQ
jgi:hypothetical protein